MEANPLGFAGNHLRPAWSSDAGDEDLEDEKRDEIDRRRHREDQLRMQREVVFHYPGKAGTACRTGRASDAHHG